MEIRLAVAQMLRIVGVSPKYRGYGYLLCILTLAVEDRRRLHNLSIQLYPAAAEYFGISCAQVERSIRFLIQHSWDADAAGRLRALFTVYNIDYVPTNREFISVLSERILHGDLSDSVRMRLFS